MRVSPAVKFRLCSMVGVQTENPAKNLRVNQRGDGNDVGKYQDFSMRSNTHTRLQTLTSNWTDLSRRHRTAALTEGEWSAPITGLGERWLLDLHQYTINKKYLSFVWQPEVYNEIHGKFQQGRAGDTE